MSNAPSLLLRSVIIYAVCLPLAVFLGYMLATPERVTSFALLLTILAIFSVPLLLKWHHIWLVTAWNMQAMLFFLPGRPTLALTMCAISLFISLLHHTLNSQMQFIRVPTINRPLIFLTVVVLVTAQLRGGIGLYILGSQSVGGKHYVWLASGILGYFALTALRIPPRKVALYVGLFYLSALTTAIANLTSLVGPSAVYYIFLVFPPENLGITSDEFIAGDPSIERLGGVAAAATAIFSAMLAFYGVGGVFNGRKIWRPALFLLACVGALFGGFRSILIGFTLTFALVFWLEGLMRTRFLPVMLFFAVLGAALVVPFTDKLPLSVQRTISFVPYININSFAEQSAKGSTEWRIEMWKAVLPDVPKYLLLGKGYSMSATEMEMIMATPDSELPQGSILAGDYHSGPLSVIMPFGLPGVIAFVWLLWAGAKVLRSNYKFGNPAFKRINTFLYASFLAKILFFLFVFGSLYSDLAIFTGLIGLSVCINGGMMKPAPRPKPAVIKFKKPDALIPAHAIT